CRSCRGSLSHLDVAAEGGAVLDNQPRHAHVAVQRAFRTHDQLVVSGDGPPDLASGADLDVARGLQRALDGAGHAQVALDVQLTDQPVPGPEDYRIALTVGRLGRAVSGRTPAAHRLPCGRAR